MKNGDAFVLVEASKLSLDDEFMKYRPMKKLVKMVKKELAYLIRKGLKDFYVPKYSPSFNESGDGICFEPAKKPAVCKSYEWWGDIAKDFAPHRGSRLGTRSEYIAFCGVLIKSLVAEGWKIKKAWEAVCFDSREIGHYWNSEFAKEDLEPTGSRKVCGFFDLGNVCKLLACEDEAGGFYLAGGDFIKNSTIHPIAIIYRHVFSRFNDYMYCSGWIVLEK